MSVKKDNDDSNENAGIRGLSMSADYGAHASTAKAGVFRTMDAALRATAAILPLRRETAEPFVASDWGCADGVSSLPLFERVFQAVRKIDPERALSMVYFDNSPELAERISKTLETHPESYLKTGRDLDVAVRCVQDSFYRQKLAANSVDFIYSSIAMHWYSQDLLCESHLYNRFGTVDERKRAAELAAADWEVLLENLAAALKPGGRAVLVNLTTFEKEDAFDFTARVIYDSIWQVAKELSAAGGVSKEQLRRLSLGLHHRTAGEFELPFTGSDLRDPKSGLKLEEAGVFETPCTYFERYKNSKASDRAVVFGAGLVNSARGWSESSVANVLGTETAARLYRQLADVLAVNPEGSQTPFILHQMLLSKPVGV